MLNINKTIAFFLFFFINNFVSLYSINPQNHESYHEHKAENFKTPQEEIDYIYSLLSYAIVFKNWQFNESDNARGYNIGCCLVDRSNELVAWDRNNVIGSSNSSNHGEVRCIRNFLKKHNDIRKLAGYTLYSTLEPCAMCCGMACLTALSRFVYGQEDSDLNGKAWERLTASTPYPPYFRVYKAIRPVSQFKKCLDESFQNFLVKNPNLNIVSYLFSKEAYNIYAKINYYFNNYKTQYQNNVIFYEKAKIFLQENVN